MHENCIRNASRRQKIISAQAAARLVKDGMVVGMSGFTRAGDAKAVPLAMAERAGADPFKIFLLTGAFLGYDIDKRLCEAGITAQRLPFQMNAVLRKAINRGAMKFINQHLSDTVEQLHAHQLPDVDCTMIEAIAITQEGYIVPTPSVGNSVSFALLARQVIVEINLSGRPALEGMHDIYIPGRRLHRGPIAVTAPDSRIGTPYIAVPAGKIAAAVISDLPASISAILPPDAETRTIANHLADFFKAEMKAGRLARVLPALQSGIGTVANAVVADLKDSPFENITIYSEVLQDSTFALMDAWKLDFASGCSITLSEACGVHVWKNFDRYRDRLFLRLQETSNHPEIVCRPGVISINTALEFDIYANVNSTHVNGTHMMNGIGSSGDFIHNALMFVFVTKALARNGAVSSVVPMVPHIDHSEHDTSILVTDIGIADLRGLAQRERAPVIIKNCAHPSCRDRLEDYCDRTCKERGRRTPHILEEVYSWHIKEIKEGSIH